MDARSVCERTSQKSANGTKTLDITTVRLPLEYNESGNEKWKNKNHRNVHCWVECIVRSLKVIMTKTNKGIRLYLCRQETCRPRMVDFIYIFYSISRNLLPSHRDWATRIATMAVTDKRNRWFLLKSTHSMGPVQPHQTHITPWYVYSFPFSQGHDLR